MTTMVETRITTAGVDLTLVVGRRVRIENTVFGPVVGAWLTSDSTPGTLMTATVLDDERGVLQVGFNPRNLTVLEGEPSEPTRKALAALALAEQTRRTQAGEFEAWKLRLSEEAGAAAVEHGWCSVYDELCEAFGLPIIREDDYELEVVVRATVTVSAKSRDDAESQVDWSLIENHLRSGCIPDWEFDD